MFLKKKTQFTLFHISCFQTKFTLKAKVIFLSNIKSLYLDYLYKTYQAQLNIKYQQQKTDKETCKLSFNQSLSYLEDLI